MLIKDKVALQNFLNDLEASLERKKDVLFKLNKDITLDTDRWISDDYKTLLEYLRVYVKHHFDPNLMVKPKGKILIILSYNEPFILSIIPILNALLVGNEVVVRPSKSSERFLEMVWEADLLKKYNLSLEISHVLYDEIETLIPKFQSVYFFGSLKIAKELSAICGRNYVEFHPEVEASDTKIFKKKEKYIQEDVALTLEEAFSHSGQTCQRIQGVFIHEGTYKEYISALKDQLESTNLSDICEQNYWSERERLVEKFTHDIRSEEVQEIVEKDGLPLVLIGLREDSKIATEAYFLPVLWITPFESSEELVKKLNSRKFYLGLNIQSEEEKFIDFVIENTRFNRYTVNTSHIDVRPYEGWGGSWPSGYSGYRDWIYHFSNPYIVIGDKK